MSSHRSFVVAGLMLLAPLAGTAAAEPRRATTAVGLGVVVVDPGHGGRDLGAVGVNGLQEKDVTLAVARRLAARIAASEALTAVLTRVDDQATSLAERLAVAGSVEADLLVSLHADSLPGRPDVRGASVYTSSDRASDAEAARKARRENLADARLTALEGIDDARVRTILTSLLRTAAAERATTFALTLTAELATVTPLLPRPHRAADFVVLRSLRTPSVLVELGYLSNRDDAKALRDPAHQAALADAIFRAILGYFAARE